MPSSLRAAALSLASLSLACGPNEPSLSTSGTESTTAASSGGSDADATEGVDETTAGPVPVCGDGMVEGDEECDDGMANADDAACTSTCTAAMCGDGLVWAGMEACDDANAVDDDDCGNDCQLPGFCGDGVVEGDEECDDGRANAPSGACMPDCTAAICGDGVVHTGVEQCDDANADNNDACTELCAPPTCGDGFAQTVNSELCDDGDAMEGDECNGDCTTAGLWTDTYNGAADNIDEIHGVAADSAGNVIVAGETYVTGESSNVWVRKYDPDGGVLWTQTYHGVTADIGYGVAVSASDEIFVAGSSYTLSNGRDAWLRRYSPAGAPAWTQTFDGPLGDDEELYGVAVDPSGNVLVTGYTTTATGQRDIWIRKYTGAGATTWTRTATGTGNDNDEGHAVAADADGNVLVTGYVWAGAQSRDLWIRKYDPAGNELWTQTYSGPDGGNDEGNGIAADSAGNVIVTGYHTVANAGRDVWVRKHDPDGSELWTATYDAPQHDTDLGRAVAVDGDDAIIVAGSVFRGAQSDNIWIRKYDPDGSELWTSTYNSDGFGSDVANGVATDPSGNIAVGGAETRADLGEYRNAWVRRILQ